MKKLTKRELEVLDLLSQGFTNKEISIELNISVHTVKANLENIYEKIGIHNRVLASIYYFKNNFDRF